MNYSSRTLVNPTNNQLMCTNLSYMGPHLVSTSHRNNGQRESSPNGLVSGWWLTRVYLRSMKLNIVFMRSFLPTLFEDASIITFFWWLNVANQNNQVFRGWSHPHDNCTFHQTGYIYMYIRGISWYGSPAYHCQIIPIELSNFAWRAQRGKTEASISHMFHVWHSDILLTCIFLE